MTRGATLFSGGGGVEARLKDSIDFVHAVEYDPAVAAVYRRNHGEHVQVADVCDVDYSSWGALDYLHASPVCKNASQAKTNGEESDLDIRTALAVVRCLDATQPRVFTLENVGGYARFEAYRRICRALDGMGYMWHAEILNAADYGVPQTRRRLILRAVRDSLLPGLPPPLPWVGWYAAIEDLIPTLPPSQFAPWQLERLPEGLRETALIEGTEMRGEISPIFAAHPSCVVKATTHKGMSRAFIADGQTNGGGADLTVRDGQQPMYTPPKAWLVPDQNTGNGRGQWVRAEDQPSMTLGGTGQARAWLAHGKVVKMTPRALARFQSLPDDFWLPEKAALACTVIGNAVPSLLMREIVRPLL